MFIASLWIHYKQEASDVKDVMLPVAILCLITYDDMVFLRQAVSYRI